MASALTRTQAGSSNNNNMVLRDRDVKNRNAARREYISQQSAKSKSRAKLSRRLEIKRAEAADSTGELKRRRLEDKVPRTIEGSREWVGAGGVAENAGGDRGGGGGGGKGDEGAGDPRTRPVKIKHLSDNNNNKLEEVEDPENAGHIELDMAGLHDLFDAPDDHQKSSSGDSVVGPGPILLTTSPRPHGPTYAFLTELQSLLGGGKQYAQVLPRKNARFELSRVVKWAKKRGYRAVIVVGEDLKGEPG